jgi:hypothetical protein
VVQASLTMALVLVEDIVDLGLDLIHHSRHDCDM